ncbi:MAG: late competence development ComFB family protein [Nitrospinota bacterium]
MQSKERENYPVFQDIQELREEIRNHSEDVVFNAICSQFRLNPEFCVCKNCLEDIFALSLNNLPPRYGQPHQITERVGPSGSDEAFVQAVVAVKKAMERVGEFPHHSHS